MPRLVHMTWVASQKRWTKMYKGTRYYVSTRELGTPPTMADSLLAANRWWENKKLELDGQRAAPAPGSDAAVSALLEAWHGEPLAGPADALASMASLLDYFRDKPIPPEVTLAILGPERLAQVEAQAQPRQAAPPDKTVGTLADRWVATERQRVTAGKLGADRMDSNRRCLVHFVDWLGAHSPPEQIDEGRWLDWYTYLAGRVQAGVWNNSHVNRIYAVSKRFVRFLWELRLIELPRNLDKKTLAFTLTAKEVEIFTDEEVRALWSVVKNQSRLHVAMMLNLGFTSKDINDLRQDEVDWTAGVVTRKRSKTRKNEDVPTVRYKLWESTFSLLKQWRSADPEIVLLTQSGGRWILPHQGDVSFSRSDCVASALRVWLRNAGVKRPPKALRATAASKLGEHPSYKFYVPYFLGHSPRTVADRHYRRPTDTEFFEALSWLEGALGLAGC